MLVLYVRKFLVYIPQVNTEDLKQFDELTTLGFITETLEEFPDLSPIGKTVREVYIRDTKHLKKFKIGNLLAAPEMVSIQIQNSMISSLPNLCHHGNVMLAYGAGVTVDCGCDGINGGITNKMNESGLMEGVLFKSPKTREDLECQSPPSLVGGTLADVAQAQQSCQGINIINGLNITSYT